MAAHPKLVALERADSLAEPAYLSLREQIATGGLGSGERVTERALGLRLGVSATPIRTPPGNSGSPRTPRHRCGNSCTPRPSYEPRRHGSRRRRSAPTLGAMKALLEELEHDPATGDPVRGGSTSYCSRRPATTWWRD